MIGKGDHMLNNNQTPSSNVKADPKTVPAAKPPVKAETVKQEVKVPATVVAKPK